MSMKIFMLVLWLIDIMNMSFYIGDVNVGVFIDDVLPLNFVFWLLFWLLCPASKSYNIDLD